MEHGSYKLNKCDTEILNVNDFNIQICCKGQNCEEIDFYHFVNFYHEITKKTDSIKYELDEIISTDYLHDVEEKPILTKSFSQMNDNEKRMLVDQSQKILAQLNKIEKLYIDKCRCYEDLLSKFENVAFVKGEKEALDSRMLTFLRLNPTNKFTEESIGDDYHFRLAESQFYRLIYGTDNNNFQMIKPVSYKVIYVDFVVNCDLLEKFNKCKALLLSKRGQEYCKTVLGFHGTAESNMIGICERGFLDPTHVDFKQATDSGYYGRGIYFSQSPTYAMQYIRGCTSLLLCQVTLGRVFRCDVVNHGQSCESGFDSHCSPNGNELVVFTSDQILPRYIVHFEIVTNDINITDCVPHLIKYNSKFELEGNTLSMERIQRSEKRKATETDVIALLSSAKKLRPSRLLEDVRMCAQSPTWSNDMTIEIEALLTDHGAIIDKVNFSIIVTDEENYKNPDESLRVLMERNVPVILLNSLLPMLIEGKSIKTNITDLYH